MTPRARLIAYLIAVVAATLIHAPPLLAAALAMAVVAAGADRWRLMRRTLFAVLAFNLAVSLGYVAAAAWRGDFNGGYLLLVNLRVLLMVFLGFWFVARADVLAALAGWPTLCWIATLSIGQIGALRRIADDFRLAFASRNIRRPRLATRLHHAAAQSAVMLDKSTAAAAESALAMKSRGCFDA